MTRPSLRGAVCCALNLVGLLAAGIASADPMRPLPGTAAASAAAARVPAAPATPTPATGARAVAPRSAPALVAIRQDADGVRRALIGERWVTVGDKVDAQGTVAAIGDSSIELRERQQRTTLHLLPPLVASTAPADAPRATSLAQAAASPRTRNSSTP